MADEAKPNRRRWVKLLAFAVAVVLVGLLAYLELQKRREQAEKAQVSGDPAIGLREIQFQKSANSGAGQYRLNPPPIDAPSGEIQGDYKESI